jgi:hypothetical protein
MKAVLHQHALEFVKESEIGMRQPCPWKLAIPCMYSHSCPCHNTGLFTMSLQLHLQGQIPSA